MTQYNAAILEVAGQYLGEREFPGAKHNDVVVGFFAEVGHDWVQDDETAWCAAFVGSVLAQIGLPHTGALNARSYTEWGAEVAPHDVRPGDVCVLWRVSPTSWQGHVAFVVQLSGDRVLLRGGNQGNSVSDAWYPVARVLAYRRADAAADVSTGRPVLRYGDRGAFVLDLQNQLRDLGYALGRMDAVFGDRTRAAVLAFQGDNGLTTDGIVGRKTWAALAQATPRKARQVSEDELRLRGSETIAIADKGERQAMQAGGVLVSAATVDTALEVVDKLQDAESGLQVAQRVMLDNWPILIVAAIGVALIWGGPVVMAAIRGRRVKDAQSGAHLGR